MKKTGKLLIAIFCVFLCVVLASCGVSNEKVIGVWSGSYTYNGNSFEATFTVNADNTFSKVVMKNGSYASDASGKWKIEGDTLVFYDYDDENSRTIYNVSGDSLENGGHYFNKVG